MFEVGRTKKPELCHYSDELLIRANQIADDDARKKVVAFAEQLNKKVLTYIFEGYGHSEWAFVNFHVSACYSCNAFTVWVEDKIVHPVSHSVVEPHEMMPPSVKADFEEAGSIVNLSPRGAAALAPLVHTGTCEGAWGKGRKTE